MQKLPTARQIFSRKNMGPNFMTPNRRFLLTGETFAIEVSEGRGMDNQPIFGVTVRYRRPESNEHLDQLRGISKLFGTISEAMEYAEDARKASCAWSDVEGNFSDFGY